MKITKITKQQKRDDRYSIYVDDKYLFSLSDYQLAGSGLVVGREYTKEELDNFATESQFGKMYERALNYVLIRPRSKKEIHDYLTRSFLYPRPRSFRDKENKLIIKQTKIDKNKVTALITKVKDRLLEKGYIDDEKFAKLWVQSRLIYKKPSLRRLKQELSSKGITGEIVDIVLQDLDETERGNLRDMVAKKRRQARYQDNIKLTQYLLRQGFNYEDIKDELGISR